MASTYLFKIIIAGSGGSGKTTLLKRYTTGLFTGGTKMTIGVDFNISQTDTQYGKTTLQIWDFGGEDRFRSMLPDFCRGASGALMLFDPTRPKTFHELEEWMEIVRGNTKDVPLVLISSKQDLIDDGQPFSISEDSIKEFMQKNKIQYYYKVSSKTGFNVSEVFVNLSEQMIERTLDA